MDAAGGLADEVEPQVYDMLLPETEQPLRVTFDPDALPEHPASQLITFGSALLDQLLTRAQARGRLALAYLDDMHLTPHALAQRVRRDLILPSGMNLQIESARPQYVTTTLFWFETTFISDEKEQAQYPVAVDRYYGRLVRYLEPLLDPARLAEIRRYPYPAARSQPLDQTYLGARERVVRTLIAEAHSRQHELQSRLAQQRERMTRYFADLRAELNERLEKAHTRGEESDDAATRTDGSSVRYGEPSNRRAVVSQSETSSDSLRLRLEALNREETLRLEELQRKATLRVQLQLTNLLHIKIPRLFVDTQLVFPQGTRAPMPLKLTWDPLTEKTDAFDCPHCNHPTYELRVDRRGALRCPNCAAD